jgi:hypothetical protein
MSGKITGAELTGLAAYVKLIRNILFLVNNIFSLFFLIPNFFSIKKDNSYLTVEAIH